MFENVLNTDFNGNSALQVECVNELEKLFDRKYIGEVTINNYTFLGVRGNYIDKENYCLNFKFDYKNYSIELFLMYDQFEYYIEKDNVTLKKRIIEDFVEDNMVEEYTRNLKKDLSELKI